MSISLQVKKKITNDWIDAFPSLSAYTGNKLYKIIGPIVAGVEIFKLPRNEQYQPYFVCYPLWKENIGKCMDAPILLNEIRNKRGMQFKIPYANHSFYLDDAVLCTRKQILIPLDIDVILSCLFELIDIQFNDILIKSNSAHQAKTYELKFFSALYANSKNNMENILDQIKQASLNWDFRLFNTWFGDFNTWINFLHNYLSLDREKFIDQINVNKKYQKFEKFSFSELKI